MEGNSPTRQGPGVDLDLPNAHTFVLADSLEKPFDQAPSAIRSIRRSVARASPIAVWSPPGSFWYL